MTEIITLKNGAVEASALVKVLTMTLHALMKRNPILFYELVMKARNPDHKFFGTSEKALIAAGLIQEGGGHLHSSIRNIILSSVEGEGLELRLVSPEK